MSSLTTTPINLQEEYSNTEIAKILNILDEELVNIEAQDILQSTIFD